MVRALVCLRPGAARRRPGGPRQRAARSRASLHPGSQAGTPCAGSRTRPAPSTVASCLQQSQALDMPVACSVIAIGPHPAARLIEGQLPGGSCLSYFTFTFRRQQHASHIAVKADDCWDALARCCACSCTPQRLSSLSADPSSSLCGVLCGRAGRARASAAGWARARQAVHGACCLAAVRSRARKLLRPHASVMAQVSSCSVGSVCAL